MSVRGALRKERAYREQYAVSQKQRLFAFVPPGRSVHAVQKGKAAFPQ